MVPLERGELNELFETLVDWSHHPKHLDLDGPEP